MATCLNFAKRDFDSVGCCHGLALHRRGVEQRQGIRQGVVHDSHVHALMRVPGRASCALAHTVAAELHCTIDDSSLAAAHDLRSRSTAFQTDHGAVGLTLRVLFSRFQHSNRLAFGDEQAAQVVAPAISDHLAIAWPSKAVPHVPSI